MAKKNEKSIYPNTNLYCGGIEKNMRKQIYKQIPNFLANKKLVRGFTITELLVAIGLLVAVLAASTMVFHYSIEAQRTAMATAEIMRNFRAITDQLNSDFAGLRKDGEIFVIWAAEQGTHERFDRVMFFANGDFQSYSTPVIHGDLARISYMLAKRDNAQAAVQSPEKRILARTQHIFTADTTLPNIDPAAFTTNQQWADWHNKLEYDKITMEQWKNMPWNTKDDMLTVITDVTVGGSTVADAVRGTAIDTTDPNSIHMILCQGVGQFKVQGWYAPQKRWVPEVDPDGNGNLSDSDFFINGSDIDPCSVPGVLYPYPPNGVVLLGGPTFDGNYYTDLLNEENFGFIPGLGRALKFTFTLYDSKGILKGGRRFEHIVYIGQ